MTNADLRNPEIRRALLSVGLNPDDSRLRRSPRLLRQSRRLWALQAHISRTTAQHAHAARLSGPARTESGP